MVGLYILQELHLVDCFITNVAVLNPIYKEGQSPSGIGLSCDIHEAMALCVSKLMSTNLLIKIA